MNKTAIDIAIVKSSRFRTPAGTELELGLWCDRLGEVRDRNTGGEGRPRPFRMLGLYAAVGIRSGAGFCESLAGRIEFKEGDAILVSPEEPCVYWPDGEWTQRFIVWGGPEAGALANALFPQARKEPPLIPGGAEEVFRAYEKLQPLMELEGVGAAFERRIELERLLLALSRHSSGPGGRRIPEAIERALELLSGKGGEMEISRVAKECALSPTHFRRLFKESVGRSPKDYALSLRLSKAKALLGEGLGLKETASACGFSDVFHFMRSFRKGTGMTAGSYAKSLLSR